jgi:hypothetical protein
VLFEAFKAGKIAQYRMTRLIGFAWSKIVSVGLEVSALE